MWPLTSNIGGQLAIAKPPSGHTALEVPAIGREVSLDEGVEVVIVTYVHRRVAEREEPRHKRLRFPTMSSSQKEDSQEQQAPDHLHWRQVIDRVYDYHLGVEGEAQSALMERHMWALYKCSCTHTKWDGIDIL